MLGKLLAKNHTLLGRWSREGLKKSLLKADMASSDHCGTCTLFEVQSVPHSTVQPTKPTTDTLEYYTVVSELESASSITPSTSKRMELQ